MLMTLINPDSNSWHSRFVSSLSVGQFAIFRLTQHFTYGLVQDYTWLCTTNM